jgi:hypothetical protein
MKHPVETLRALPIDMFVEDAPIQRWEREPFAALSDDALTALCAQAIAKPKQERNGNSFVLHAPLELLARRVLLNQVSREVRAIARRRIAEIAVRYAHAGEEHDLPPIGFNDTDAAIEALARAMDDGDQATAHAAARYLLDHKKRDEIRALLIDRIAPMLGAAGHSPILFAEWMRESGLSSAHSHLLLAPLYYLLSPPRPRLTWIDAFDWREPASWQGSIEAYEASLSRALTQPPKIETTSSSIAPTLLAADSSSEMIAALRQPLATLPLPTIERMLLRTAAQSMLQDDPAQAPYGWTHCMTLPLALLANRDVSRAPRRLCAIAATYVYAFRATMSNVAIDLEWQPEPIGRDARQDDTPQTRAAVAFHTPHSERQALRTQLANFAATHRDAHLAKYTLACFDASVRDPEFRRHYLAAAAYLGAWWRVRDALRTSART